jgi:hypothetical protein
VRTRPSWLTWSWQVMDSSMSGQCFRRQKKLRGELRGARACVKDAWFAIHSLFILSWDFGPWAIYEILRHISSWKHPVPPKKSRDGRFGGAREVQKTHSGPVIGMVSKVSGELTLPPKWRVTDMVWLTDIGNNVSSRTLLWSMLQHACFFLLFF